VADAKISRGMIAVDKMGTKKRTRLHFDCFKFHSICSVTFTTRRHHLVERVHLRREQLRFDVEDPCASKQTH